MYIIYMKHHLIIFFFFFFNDTATTEIYTLSLHDALPISPYAWTPNRVPMARIALCGVCTTKGRAVSCTTLKYASPSRETSRPRGANRTGTPSRLSALRGISVPSSSRDTARRPLGVAYSPRAGGRPTRGAPD